MDNYNRKIWSNYDIGSPEYLTGLTKFIKHAFENTSSEDRTIACPCAGCVRYHRCTEKDVFDHLVIKGPMRDFEKWYNTPNCDSISVSHHEDRISNIGAPDNMLEMLGDAFGIPSSTSYFTPGTPSETFDFADRDQQDSHVNMTEGTHDSLPLDFDMFNKLLQDAKVELYPGCKEYSKLSFVLHLYNLKCNFGWSDKSFGELLETFRKSLPLGANIPDSLYETKKIVDKLTLKYEKIDACPYDCILFWKQNLKLNECLVCGASRWRISGPSSESTSTSKGNKRKRKKEMNIPDNVLRYFPLKPRLQRLFMCSKTAELMRWHDKDRPKEDGVLRHPADSESWKKFDSQYPSFAADPRNVRLGLASDGFNPFAEMRSTYTTWPVILTIYNLPPWLCMKRPYLILSTLIPGPKSPGNDIDTYLQPLIDELKELWEVGIKVYDSFEKKSFQLRAALCWTINDFPAYGNLSGWCVYGLNACPCCNTDKWSKRYKYSGKVCYMGHRRFLNPSHNYRNDEKSFDNTKEVRLAPKPPSGSMVLDQLKDISFTLGKTTQHHLSGVKPKTWKKRSIFFELPYWEHNMLRHNLDVMHIEKNVCDNIIYTLLNDPKKTKDNLKARQTLEEIGVRKQLWPQPKASGKYYLPPAPYNLSNQGKDNFCKVLSNVKFPDGYASNISRCVLKRKLSGLKSHDCHVLMQLMLPLAMRESLHEKVASVLIELCDFFRALCSKTLYIAELDRLETKIAVILCNLEKLFPPTFFTIMVHLVVHLAGEARIGGPVQYRWMYPIERFLSTLKSYVGNKARPEGSIAETYLVQECVAFCSLYLEGAEDVTNRSSRNTVHYNDNVNDQESSLFPFVGQHYGRVEGFMMDEKTRTQAHRYVLFNCNNKEIESLAKDHISFLKRTHRRSRPTQHVIDRMHSEEFVEWLKIFVNDPDNKGDIRITEDVVLLVRGPLPMARRFHAFDMKNGYRFRTKEYEKNKSTQNSGVKVVAKTQSYASSRDKHPILGNVTYYGILTDIIELNFYSKFLVPMFRCDWVNVHSASGLKKDKLGFTLVNFSHLIHSGERISDEPFVFASQVDQVIYVQDQTHPDWFIPRSINPRGTFDLGDDNLEVDMDDESHSSSMEDNFDIDLNELSDVEGTYVDN